MQYALPIEKFVSMSTLSLLIILPFTPQNSDVTMETTNDINENLKMYPSTTMHFVKENLKHYCV